jgi:fucose permease
MKQRSLFMVVLIFLIFFVISFLTNIIGPLVPDIIRDFKLNLTLVALLPFAFFIAYGVMSIPAGFLVERYKEKKVMAAAFGVAFLGALLFSLMPNYLVAIVSLFLIGVGMAALQVAINPLLRVSGGEEHFAFNSVMAQLFFGGASFLSPRVYTYLTARLQGRGASEPFFVRWLSRVTPKDLPWIALYWVFALLTLVMVAVIILIKFPAVERTEEEKAGAWETHKALFKNKTVVLFFIGIFAYVATEQGTANWMSQFLSVYHRFDPQLVGAKAVSWFWGMMTIGCLLGLLLLKLWDSRKVLIVFASAAIVLLSLALFGPSRVALYAFPMMGFAASVMWSIIFSLALNSLDRHHGTFSGILCTGIIGGAIGSLAIGWLGDRFGLRVGMLFLYITLGYILSIGLWARPLITNKTISSGKKD